MWILDADAYVDYQDILTWRCPSPGTKNGIMYQTCQSPNPILTDDIVIGVDFSPGNVFACDRENGKLIWTVNLRSLILYPPIVTPAGVLVCTSSYLWMLEPESGKLVWKGPYNPSTLPKVHDDLIIIGDQHGLLDCFDVVGGRHVWSQRVTRSADPRLNGVPAVLRQNVVIGSNAGVVKCFSISDGKLKWKKRHRRRWSQGEEFATQVAVFESGTSAHGLDSETGDTVWKKEFRGFEIRERCKTSQGMSFVISDKNRVTVEGSPEMHYSPECIVGLANGAEQWRLPYEPWPICRPIWSEATGYIYEATRQGLGIIDPNTGRRTVCITNFPTNGDLPDEAVDAPLVVDGMIYCHHCDGSLMALRHP